MRRRVMDDLLDAEEEEQLPGIVSPHVYALLASDCSALFEEMRAEAASATARDTLANAYDFLLSFMEEFTAHAAAIQARNQKLLAELLGAARRGALAFEEAIEAAREASRLDVTLLHYLDGEAARLRAAAGGDAALGAVGVIRARVAAEIDRTMGEEVSVLNRLLGFDDSRTQGGGRAHRSRAAFGRRRHARTRSKAAAPCRAEEGVAAARSPRKLRRLAHHGACSPSACTDATPTSRARRTACPSPPRCAQVYDAVRAEGQRRGHDARQGAAAAGPVPGDAGGREGPRGQGPVAGDEARGHHSGRRGDGASVGGRCGACW
ncbi:hypothetical protein JKP88DRAFT_267860 [Tribonema minus]|uniref:Uncharacterized protein n=1 Tax=Tribonema minus TaxID=303371 RepID=A0A836CI99_9STRA|nr:hypothetical protein JKP88DRAFT_267860 [Tribonema minus]